MGRTREARAIIVDLERRIQLAKEKKQEVTNYLLNLRKRQVEGNISYSQYIEKIYLKRNGRDIREWIEYYDEYIEKCERLIKQQKRTVRKQSTLVFLSLFFVFLFLIAGFYIQPRLTGLFIAEPTQIQEFRQTLNLEFNQSDIYEWKLENIGQLLSTKLSGSIEGKGTVRIYIDDLLILDNSEFQTQETGIIKGITGAITESVINESYSEEIEEALPKEDSSPSLGQDENLELPSEQLGIEELPKNETEETNVTIPEEKTPELVIKSFTDICEETCNLSNINLNKSSYTIKIEISDAKLTLDEIIYEVITIAEIPIEEIPEEILKINVTANATVITTQFQAVLGQPVKWKKQISPENLGNLTIKLPEESTNIFVNKITESYSEEIGEALPKEDSSPSLGQDENLELPSEQLGIEEPSSSEAKEKAKFRITGGVIDVTERDSIILRVFHFFNNIFKKLQGAITGKVIATEETREKEVEIEIDDDTVDYEIEYETPAPYAIEEDIKRGKRVKIIGPETVHYENVLSFTQLDESLNIQNPSRVKIRWIEQNTYIKPQKISDLNNNGIYDYIEWIAPSLSEATFEIIIEITKAEHLDSNREFISDIYEEVKTLDDVWSETISDGDYVRVTFEIPLTSKKDITIFPRVTSGSPRIEVYEVDGTELITEFTTINSNQYNKVLLTNLKGTQDTFDLKILGGSIEIDHIVDPVGDIGVEYLNEIGDVVNKSEAVYVHIWNTKDDYYFNKSSGIQFSNHFAEFWTRNIFCAGYKAGGEWVYDCNDVLPFNWNIQTDDETYVNITGWRDKTIGNKEVRLGIRYHLKLNDKNLSVQLSVKNIGENDITNDLGFAWRVNKIRIGDDEENDFIEINDTVFNLSDSLDLSFTNMTKRVAIPTFNETCFDECNQTYNETYCINQCVGVNYTYKYVPYYRMFDDNRLKYLKLDWNKNLKYKVVVNSTQQYNAPTTLGINAGPLSVGQEKSTTLYWKDADSELVLWVNAFTGSSTDWTEEGVSPYLNDTDYPDHYFWGSVVDNWAEGQFGFTDSSDLGTINDVTLAVYSMQANSDNGEIQLYLTNSTAEYLVATYVPANAEAWAWENTSVLAILPSWSEVNSAELRVVAQRTGGADIIYVDAALLRINYTIEVQWNQSDLDMGSSTNNITSTVEINSTGPNNNVVVDCSGNCTEITTNWTTHNMSSGQTDQVLITCSNTTEGSFSADFNVTSTEDTSSNFINVTCEIFSYGWLNVSISKPDDYSEWYQNYANLTVNATVTCEGGSNAKCENVTALARYNLGSNPDTAINTTEGGLPFYILGGVSNPQSTTQNLSQGDSYQFNWTLNVTIASQVSHEIDVLFNSSYGSENVDNNDTEDRTVNLNPFDNAPTVTLNSPVDYYNTTEAITFNCTASDDINLVNVSLYGNWTGSWLLNETNSSPVNATPVIFSKTINDGTYVWNCYACDNATTTQCFFADANRTFTIDSTPPTITWEPPTPDDGNITSNNWIYLNTTINDVSSTSAFFDWNYSLVGYWAMDWYNSTGIHDNSTYKNLATFHGANFGTDNITTGKYGKGLEFDGSDDYLTIPSSASSLDFNGLAEATMELWIKKSGVSQKMILYQKNQYSITTLGTNQIQCLFQTSGGNLQLNGPVVDTDWTHIAITYDGDVGRLYVNGYEEENQSTSGTISGAATTIYIGRWQFTSLYFDGIIDEVRIHNRTLSPEEINASYNNGLYKLYHNFTSLSNGTYNYFAYAIDTVGYINKTERTVTIGEEEEDTESPQWFDNSTNSTEAGTYIEHRVRWTDAGLSGYIFEFDNGTGTFNNDSFVTFTGANNWSNVSKVVNSTSGSTIRWRVYANDTASPTNWNVTDIFQYDTTSFDPCDVPINNDWNISTNCTKQNEVITIAQDKSLNILNGGNLTLINVTLLMNSTADGNSAIHVWSGGILNITDNNNDGSLINSTNPSNEFAFIVDSGSTFSMTNSQLSEAGWIASQGQMGLEINTTVTEFTGNTLTNNYYGIIFYSDNNTISNNTASSNEYGISLITSSNNTLMNNNASSNNFGIYLISSSNNNTLSNNTASSNDLGIYLSSSNNNTLSNNTASLNKYGISLTSFSNNNTLSNNTASLNEYGIYLTTSSNNNILSNNTASSNEYGIYLTTSSNNNILSNNTVSSNNYGIYLTTSSNNNLTQNTISDNLYDLSDNANNIYSLNKFIHNINNTMISIWINNQTPNVNDLVEFNISVFYPNSTACTDFSYNITTRPYETVNISTNGNNITGNFTVTELGFYSLIINITDSENNIVKRNYAFLVNTTAGIVNYYFRAVNPTHGQPGGVDSKSLLLTAPTTEESWTCTSWIQASPDDLTVPAPSFIKIINMSFWYKVSGSPQLGIQRYVIYSSEMDYSQSVPSAAEFTWINRNFTNLNWSMDYVKSWYWLSIKLSASVGNPYWYTNQTDPSYVNISYLYTTTPEIKNNTNTDVKILAATSPAGNTNNANITLDGTGTTNLTVQMPNTAITYTAKMDGDNCDDVNCSFTQSAGELNFTLTLSSEHEIEIEGEEADTDSPQWFDNSTNDTTAGTFIEHRVRWTDAGLSGYIFEFDNGTGSFNNDSFVTFTGTNNWSNVSKTVNFTEGSTIRWRVYANDTASPTNWNVTDVFQYDTTSADNPPTASLGTNPIAYYNDSDGSIVFDLKCSDDIGVDTLKLYGNWSGWHANQTNSSPVNNTWWNVTVSGIPDGTWKWAAWCNDSLGNGDWSEENRTFSVDTTPPKWFDNSTNGTTAGTFIKHRVRWTDSALAGYIFEFDNGTGTFNNDSFVTFTGTNNWSNVTKYVNETEGSTIRWRVYANDTASPTNWNATDIFSYITSADNPPTVSLGTNPVASYNDSDGSIIFDLKCSDDIGVDTLKLYGNWSGWHANQTNSSPVNNTWWNVTVNGIPEGTWKWDAWCNDTSGNEDWSEENRTFTVNFSLQCTPPVDDDWNISTNCTKQNEVITIAQDKSLNILNGGNLTLINVTLLMNSAADGNSEIRVWSGGEMNITDNNGDGSLINSTDASYEFAFIVDSGSIFSMTNSQLSECGWSPTQRSRGLEINTTVTEFTGNTLTNNYCGITFYSDNNNIANNTVNSNNYYGIYLISSSNNTLTNNNASSNKNDGIMLSSSSNNTLTNNNASSNGNHGILLFSSSSNNTLMNNIFSSNNKGIYILTSSSNNTLTNNTASSNMYGIYILTSSDNNLTQNTISDNAHDLLDGGNNLYSFNEFIHNINNDNTMINIGINNRTPNANDLVEFNISVFYPDGTTCSDFTYNITTRSYETVNTSTSGNNIRGNFTVTRLGFYSLIINITDSENNTVKTKYAFFVNTTEAVVNYYLRGVDPTHDQPKGTDSKSLLLTAPTTVESWTCSAWVQASPDDLTVPALSVIKDINISFWYKTSTDGSTGVQRYVTYDSTKDYSQSVPSAAVFTWINRNFTNLNWSMDYVKSWYWLAVKLSGDHPYWKTNALDPSYVNISYLYTTTPEIKNNTNTDILILSATSPAGNTNNANITLDGTGTANLTVQMPNTAITYTAKMDGDNCDDANCNFTQSAGELNFTLTLSSEHEIEIEGEEADTDSPQWFDNSTNGTTAGTYIEHRVRWTDAGLSGYIFEFDNGTGTFNNDSFVAMSGAEDWSNVTKYVNETGGSTIRWRVYANDTASPTNWNSTDIFEYDTTVNLCDVPTNNDWNISISCTKQNEVITIAQNKSLNILNGGNLTLINVTLLMNSTADGNSEIRVWSGGEMNITDNNGDGSLINSTDTDYEFAFIVDSGSTFSMTNSQLSECGWSTGSGQRGLEIDTIVTEFSGNTLTNNLYGVTFYSDNNIISDNNASSNGYGFFLSSSSNNTLTNNTADSNIQRGFFLGAGSNNTLTNNIASTNIANSNDYGFYLSSSSNNTLTNNTANSNNRGFYLESSSNNTLTNNTANLGYYYGFYLSGSNNILTNNLANFTDDRGFYIFSSPNNIFTNNIASLNEKGFYIGSGNSNTIFTNNTASSNDYGFYLTSSSYNITNNTISDNIYALQDPGDNIYSSNSFLYNLENPMIDILFNNQTANINDLIEFNISVFYPNGTTCDDFTYNITTRPYETVNTSTNGNNITGNFTVTRQGFYSLVINITVGDNNLVKRNYVILVNSTIGKIDYYFRDDQPTHGQPLAGAGGTLVDVGTFLLTPPTTEETRTCGWWVQASPDDLGVFIPTIIKNINISIWYKVGRTNSFLGVQRYATYDTGATVDYNQTVPEETEYTWINLNFTNLNWTMEYPWAWYWLALKMKEGTTGNPGDPWWKTNETNPSYVNISYLYTTTPEIKNNTNTDVKILAATSPAGDTNNANITLDGTGTTNLTVQMPNTAITYTAKMDGDNCDDANCNFTQSAGELNFTLTLSSEHEIEIEGEEADTDPPQWFDNSTNSTEAGTYIEHRVRWTDTALDGYIFSFDNGTGTFNNDSFVEMTGTNNWSNVSKVVNSTGSSTIRWRVYANDTASPTNWNATDIFQYDTTSANNPPTIAWVESIDPQTPIDDTTRSITFNFTATDQEGASDINVSTAQARFQLSGEATRSNLSCVNWSQSGNDVNFTCNISMWYFDKADTDWIINVTIKDINNAHGENSSTNFTYNTLTAMKMSPTSLEWDEINLTDTNTGSNNDPIVVNNTGNAELLNINVTAYDLQGEQYTSYYIYAANFTVENASDGCSGAATAMSNDTSINVTSAILYRGNHSLNYKNATSGQEELFFCLKEIPSENPAQSYSSSAFDAWEIRILLVAIIPAAKRRKKKKKEKEKNKEKQKRIEDDNLIKALDLILEELKEEYSLNKKELTQIIIEKLKKKHRISRKEILEVIKEKELEIPATILSRELGALESLVKYMKENLNMSYKAIASELKRDERTIWTAYKKASEKMKEPIKPEETKMFLPISIFKDGRLTILESIILYLKSKGLKFSEIAELLERDQRNIWTIYSRAVRKRNKEKF